MPMPRSEHVAKRPTWECTVCGEPWPCAPAKIELAEQYQSMSLGLFMASCWHEAIEHLRASEERVPTDLYERFLGWIADAKRPRLSAG
jgi:hypothetical protein